MDERGGTVSAPTTTALRDLTGDYELDQHHTRIGFAARHAMVTKVRGEFADFTGRVHVEGADLSRSGVELRIKAASINTHNEQRDAHLRSNDFLAMDEYPEITFFSTAVQPLDDETVRVTGDLTVRGVSKPVSIDFHYTGSATDPYGNLRVGFEGTTTINRKDWGVNWNAVLEGGGVMVSEKVNLEFDVSAIRVG
jgi:polyisoprenoid-binding protein YceI